MGYYDTLTPGVIQRNILENPGWYTQYTPYQAEIAQGRLEALLNYQTMVTDLTGLDIANASLLDEGTAAAEAMTMCKRGQKRGHRPATPSLSRTSAIRRRSTSCARAPSRWATRWWWAMPQGYDFAGGLWRAAAISGHRGQRCRHGTTSARAAHAAGALVVVATDLLALTLLRPPGEFGADIAVGNSQRFGVPLGYGGPHAAFMATRDDLKRIMPGRLVGVSQDAQGNPAMRLSLQTREQHIRREKATSNICTAQVLLAVMASHVRRLPRPGRAAPHCRAHAPAGRDAAQHGCASWATRSTTAPSLTRSRSAAARAASSKSCTRR